MLLSVSPLPPCDLRTTWQHGAPGAPQMIQVAGLPPEQSRRATVAFTAAGMEVALVCRCIKTSSYKRYRRHRNFSASARFPKMKNIRMIIYVFTFWRVILHNRFLLIKKHIFDCTHLIPTGAPPLVFGMDTHMIPTAASRSNTEKRTPVDKYLEATAPTVSIHTINSALIVFQSVLVQSM